MMVDIMFYMVLFTFDLNLGMAPKTHMKDRMSRIYRKACFAKTSSHTLSNT